MTINRIRRAMLPLGIASALAATMLGGYSVSVGAKQSPDKSAQQAREALSKGQYDKAIKLAEALVSGNPCEPSYRALLANAYLIAGRFGSAATTYDDAMRLGDNSARTALSLALADIAAGRSRDAVAILDDWRDAIPASDLGLALALAGETSRGIGVLSDALRGGDNTAKMRQNLAYAYALDGRWREARLMMQQDVPADRVDARISDWAMKSKPEDSQARIAALLGVPMRADPGQPQALALADSPATQQVASESSGLKQQAVAVNGELPPAAPPQAESPAELARYAPVTAPVAAPVAQPERVAVAEAAPAITYRNEAVVQPVPARQAAPVRRVAASPAPVRVAPVRVAAAAPAPVRAVRPATAEPLRSGPAPRAARGTSHFVQLGSFSSEQGARRAWGLLAARNPELRHYRMVVTPAVVHGRNFWRVAAAGFDNTSAGGMCSRVKSRGGVCFAYALTGRTPAAAVPQRQLAARQSAPKAAAAGPALSRRH